jgi:hypothetical protein
MIDRESLRKMCEWPYAPSLIGEAIVDWQKFTAQERAWLVWGMKVKEEAEK